MQHLVFNSFPRSGNVFFSNVASQTLGIDIAAVHIPQIYHVKEIYNVAIFRKPQDAISSLIYKHLDNQSKSNYSTEKLAIEHAKRYIDYVDLATKSLDNIYLANFDEVINNTTKEIEKIVNRFGINYLEGRQNFTMDQILYTDQRIWNDQYDGHTPRSKDNVRIEIEDTVASLDFIKEVDEMYLNLIKHC